MNEKNSQSSQKVGVLHFALLSFLFAAPIKAMLGEGSFVGTGGYAIGGTPYIYAGLSYYYNPEMDYYWDGQRWIFKTGAQWPPRCCKPNPCSSCGYRQASECSSVRLDRARSASGEVSIRPTASIDPNGRSLEECWKVYKNHNGKG